MIDADKYYRCDCCNTVIKSRDAVLTLGKKDYCISCAKKMSYKSHVLEDGSIEWETPNPDFERVYLRPEEDKVNASNKERIKSSLDDDPWIDEESASDSIMSWQEIYDGLSQHVIGQDDAKEKVATALFEHLIRMSSTPEERKMLPKANLLVCGNSGTGKTELFRAASKILDIPIVIADASNLTGPGYRGGDFDEALTRLYQIADRDLERAQQGIVFLDEFDKLVCNRSNDQLRSYGDFMQQTILKSIEGQIVRVPTDSTDKKGRQIAFDTSNILFVLAGAHYGIRSTENDAPRRQIGFGYSYVTPVSESRKKRALMPQDFIDYGYIPELIGRIPNIIELGDLTINDMVRILTEPKEAVVKKYQMMLKRLKANLCFEEDAIKMIAETGAKLHTGARGATVILELVLKEKIKQIARREICGDVVITKDDVEDALQDRFAEFDNDEDSSTPVAQSVSGEWEKTL